MFGSDNAPLEELFPRPAVSGATNNQDVLFHFNPRPLEGQGEMVMKFIVWWSMGI
jgi:hypothetical protein